MHVLRPVITIRDLTFEWPDGAVALSQLTGADRAGCTAAFGTDATADGNNDGVSDGRDFLIWQRNFSLTGATPTVQTIPEAAGVVLAAFALTGLGLCRRFRSRRTIAAH